MCDYGETETRCLILETKYAALICSAGIATQLQCVEADGRRDVAVTSRDSSILEANS